MEKENIMASVDTSRCQIWAVGLKSALATAAVVGTVGDWIAFGARQPAAGAPDFGATQNNGGDDLPSFDTPQHDFAPQPFDNQTQQNSGTQPSFGSQHAQRGAMTSTRSSR